MKSPGGLVSENSVFSEKDLLSVDGGDVSITKSSLFSCRFQSQFDLARHATLDRVDLQA